jgi:transcriptional regulator with XRE-family HTH domain
MNSIQEVLKKNIVQLRELRGFSQEALAERSGMSLSAVQRIEYGERWPESETVTVLAKALGVEEARLFCETEITPVVVRPSLEACMDAVAMHIKHNAEDARVLGLRVKKLETIVASLAKSAKTMKLL